MTDSLIPALDASLSRYTQPPPDGRLNEEQAALVASDFIARMVLAQGQMDVILSGKARQGEYLIGQDSHSLGTTPTVGVVAWRSHALHLRGEDLVAQSYDSKSEEFAEIVQKSRVKKEDRDDNTEQFKYGPEFLLWTERGWGTFLFAGTARENAIPVLAQLSKAVKLGNKLIAGKKHSWLVPVASAVEALPFAPPSMKDTTGAVNLFLAPVQADGIF